MQIMDDNLIEEKRKKDMSKKLNMKNTRYLAWQAEELIRVFESNPYPENDMCESLALKLNLQQHQVYKWFKNRRWRERKRLNTKRTQKNTNLAGSNDRLDGNEIHVVDNGQSNEDPREMVQRALQSSGIDTNTKDEDVLSFTIDNTSLDGSSDIPDENEVDGLQKIALQYNDIPDENDGDELDQTNENTKENVEEPTETTFTMDMILSPTMPMEKIEDYLAI